MLSGICVQKQTFSSSKSVKPLNQLPKFWMRVEGLNRPKAGQSRAKPSQAKAASEERNPDQSEQTKAGPNACVLE